MTATNNELIIAGHKLAAFLASSTSKDGGPDAKTVSTLCAALTTAQSHLAALIEAAEPFVEFRKAWRSVYPNQDDAAMLGITSNETGDFVEVVAIDFDSLASAVEDVRKGSVR